MSSKEFFYTKKEGCVLTYDTHCTCYYFTMWRIKKMYANARKKDLKTKIGYTNTVYSETWVIWQNLSHKQFLLEFITKGKNLLA